MNDERMIPTPASSDLPTTTILLDGQKMNSEYHLVSVVVTKAVNKIPTAQIRLLDGDAAQEDFPLSNSDDFVPGKTIEILAGYHSNEKTIFKGMIISHGVKARKNKPSLVVLECKDIAVKMTIVRKNAYYKEAADSDIIEDILNEYGLQGDVEQTYPQHQEMVKYYTTDWDFIVMRAEVNGKLVMVDDGNVSVKAPETDQEPALALVYGSTIMEFEANMDARNQFTGITGNSWDFTTQELLEEENDPPNFREHGNIEASTLAAVIGAESFSIRHSGHVVDQELKSWANATMLKQRLSKILGRVRCQGIADLKPGQVINLNGVGDRFNGKAFVSAVQQQIDAKNWETDIQFGLSLKWFAQQENIVDVPAAGLLPAVHGLQIGIVSQLQDDPDGEDRVLVRMPVIDSQGEGVWARVACVDAGENRGVFFRPEIDDEVVLGFLNDDPRDPIILGMLNSSAKPAPLTARDENHEKGIVTLGKIKLIFNDDQKSVTLETPNGKMLSLSDKADSITLKDEHNNIIELKNDGIFIESAGDIHLKAKGKVDLQGMNINIGATSQVKVAGKSGAEFSSTGNTVIQGTPVKIN